MVMVLNVLRGRWGGRFGCGSGHKRRLPMFTYRQAYRGTEIRDRQQQEHLIPPPNGMVHARQQLP